MPRKNTVSKKQPQKKPARKLKFYIAGRLKSGEAKVADLITFVEKQGHEITFDWTKFLVRRPFGKNCRRSHQAAHNMAMGVLHADVVVVLADRTGLGMHIETGGALVLSIVLQFIQVRKDRKILMVGKDNDKSIFYYHRSVTRVRSFEAAKKLIEKMR